MDDDMMKPPDLQKMRAQAQVQPQVVIALSLVDIAHSLRGLVILMQTIDRNVRGVE